MDPLSQAVLGGAVAAAACRKRPWIRAAALAGIIGGVLADVDVVFHSDSDPLFGIMLHRHFTHSLAFIPLGGLAAALLAWPLLRRVLAFRWIYSFAMLGYATHGLLDAMTSYGTHLLLPFTESREAWNVVSVIDPLFTLPLLVFFLLSVRRKARKFAVIGLCVALAYLGLGWMQRERVEDALQVLADARGHNIERFEVMPSFGNIILWRTIYQSDGRLYVDAARAAQGDVTWYEGKSVEALYLPEVIASLSPASPLVHDIERFHLFAHGWLAPVPDKPYLIADMRYAALPNSIDAFWMLRTYPVPPEIHGSFERRVGRKDRELDILWEMIKGNDL